MMCCVIAAFLFAQVMAMVRRWGIYWGVVRPDENEEDLPTLGKSLRALFAKPAFRTAIIAVALIEIGSASIWLYSDHRDHIAQIGRSAFSLGTALQTGEIKICSAAAGKRALTLASLPDAATP
jgi:hypothetical protein